MPKTLYLSLLLLLPYCYHHYDDDGGLVVVVVLVVTMMFQMRGTLLNTQQEARGETFVTKPPIKRKGAGDKLRCIYISFPQKVQHVTIMERRKSSEFLIFSFRVHDGYETKRYLVH